MSRNQKNLNLERPNIENISVTYKRCTVFTHYRGYRVNRGFINFHYGLKPPDVGRMIVGYKDTQKRIIIIFNQPEHIRIHIARVYDDRFFLRRCLIRRRICSEQITVAESFRTIMKIEIQLYSSISKIASAVLEDL
jgi:hypothetical protein